MADEDERLRSIRFPQWLWDAIDTEAKQHKRSSVKQMEVVLSLYYGSQQPAVDAGRISSLQDALRPPLGAPAAKPAESKPSVNETNGVTLAPSSSAPIKLERKEHKKKKTA